ncbi:ComEA family DNA-binding protein [Micromonospora sp. HM5-17]|nr:ComEA family DNA-binding protein [Micromonospora sp. HM5-17]
MVRERLVRLLGPDDRTAPIRPATLPPAGSGSGRVPAARPRPREAGPPSRSGPLTEVGSPAEPGPLAAAGSAERTRPPEEDGGPGRLGGPGPFDPGRRGVRALAVVAAIVVLGAAAWAWLSRPRAEPLPEPPAGGSAVVPASVPPSAGTGSPEVVVAVAGRVRRPGLVRLPAGARVADALAAAGGAQPGVDVALLNLARKVTDGELILVGVTPPPGAAPPGVAAGGGTVAPGTGGKVNLNTATVAQLDALPGVGPVLAQRIVEHRERIGGFRSVSDLRQVNGIGDARYEELKDLVTV